MSDPMEKGFHLKKEVSYGHLLSTITLIIGGLAFAANLDKRVSVLENERQQQEKRDARQDAEAIRFQGDIRQSLRNLDIKMDRVLERRN